MIREIGVELQAALRAQGCPIPVVNGSEAADLTNTYGRQRIVIERDEEASDSIGEPRVQSQDNPRMYAVRNIAVKLTIYGQITAPGAKYFEHCRHVEHILDLVIVALIDIKAARRNQIKWSGGRFVRPVDLEKSETPAGAMYELKFTFDRGITKRTWAGEARPEATLGVGSLVTDKRIALAGAVGADDPDDDETHETI